MKYLIIGLGNFGDEYFNTRHNIGFDILDAFAKEFEAAFKDKRYAFVTSLRHKGRGFHLIKPTTYVNLSGKAVNYWLKKLKIDINNILVVTDDISLPFGKIRLRAKGGSAGHNGLENINLVLGTNNYARLRFGIGNEFNQGGQVNYVLSQWTKKEEKELPEKINEAVDIIKKFGTIGIERTMNQFN